MDLSDLSDLELEQEFLRALAGLGEGELAVVEELVTSLARPSPE